MKRSEIFTKSTISYYILYNIILMWPKFWFSRLYLGKSKTLLKKYHKNGWHKTPSFHIIYVQLIFTFRHINMPDLTASYGTPLILLRLFGYFHDDHSCLNYYIFIKLLQIICLINLHILVCQNAKCDCKLWKILWFNCVFLRVFIHYDMFQTL